MKSWINKLVNQLDFEWQNNPSNKSGINNSNSNNPITDITEEKATLLYIIDTFNKYLVELDAHPIRKTRESFDEYAKMIVKSDGPELERALFNFRKFFSSYRIDEATYIQQSFDDFKTIIWDFVDQLTEDFKYESEVDENIQGTFERLKEAVEADSIDDIRSSSRSFIDTYVSYQHKQDVHKKNRMESIQDKLQTVKEKLVEANRSMRLDHLTSAYNRKSFDEQMEAYEKLKQHVDQDLCLVMMDIDHFKNVNDTYGHAIGDFVLIECVKMLQDGFIKDKEFVARTGGEEFAVILPNYLISDAMKVCKEVMESIRKEVFIEGEHKINFTLSMGLAKWEPGESIESLVKRADAALYISKENGRDRLTTANKQNTSKQSA